MEILRLVNVKYVIELVYHVVELQILNVHNVFHLQHFWIKKLENVSQVVQL